MGLNIFKKQPKQATIPASVNHDDLDPEIVQSDLEKLMEFEKSIKGKKPEVEERSEQGSKEARARQVKNPFRGT